MISRLLLAPTAFASLTGEVWEESSFLASGVPAFRFLLVESVILGRNMGRDMGRGLGGGLATGFEAGVILLIS